MALFTPVVSSTFTGADESPLSEGGVWTSGSEGGFKRLSNIATPISLAVDSLSYYSGASFANDQFAQGNLTENGTSGNGAGVGLCLRRASAATRTYLRFVTDAKATNNAEISRFIAGAYTQLAIWTQPFTTGDLFTFAVLGTLIFVFDKTGQCVMAVNDPSAPASGYPGVAYSSTSGSVVGVDNFVAGSFTPLTTETLDQFTWVATQGSIGAYLNDQPTYREYTFVDGTIRRDYK